jgi:hypothetical protein
MTTIDTTRPTGRQARTLEECGYGGDGPRRYCDGCRTDKAFSGGRCFDCATKLQAFYAGLLMPRQLPFGQVAHYTIDHVIGSWREERMLPLREGERRLGWFTLPPFQRPAVWTQAQQIKLIESLWLGLPVGAYCYNQPSINHPTQYWLIDGQQRITALLAYVADEFPVFDYRWSELGPIEQRGFLHKGFPAVQLNLEDEAVLEDLYNRLAYGGTAHEPPAVTEPAPRRQGPPWS